MIHRPIGKNSAAVNIAVGHGPEYARIVGADAVVDHDEIAVLGHAHRTEIAEVLVLRRHVRLGNNFIVDVDRAAADLHGFTGQSDDALDKGLRAVQRIPKDHDVAALDGLKTVDKFVDEDALLVGEQRRHAGASDFHGLVQEDDDDERQADGDKKVAGPDANFVTKRMR